jgi:hypothetical protein
MKIAIPICLLFGAVFLILALYPPDFSPPFSEAGTEWQKVQVPPCDYNIDVQDGQLEVRTVEGRVVTMEPDGLKWEMQGKEIAVLEGNILGSQPILYLRAKQGTVKYQFRCV